MLKEIKNFINNFEDYIHKDDLLNHISKIESSISDVKKCKNCTYKTIQENKIKVFECEKCKIK